MANAYEKSEVRPRRTKASTTKGAVPASDRAANAAASAAPALPLDSRELLPFRLLLLSNALGKGAVRLYSGRFGLPIAEWRLLATLHGNEPATVAGLAAALGTDKGWISRTVATLVEKGLCRTTADANDARSFHITTTRSGRALHARIMPAAIDRHLQLAGVFTPDELATFNEWLARLTRRAELLAAGALDGPGDGLAAKRRSAPVSNATPKPRSPRGKSKPRATS
jgi:DNA-binding MarR family transcriptional regulator